MPVDLKEFYKMKFNNFQVREVKSFEDIFDKPLTKLEEFRLFKKFEKAKKYGDEELQSFKKDNNLVEVDLQLLFKKYIQNPIVLEDKMKMYSANERFELFQQWQELKKDTEKELEFIEQHDLFGALPSFFKFDEEDMGELI